jgi:hypothetical protein
MKTIITYIINSLTLNFSTNHKDLCTPYSVSGFRAHIVGTVPSFLHILIRNFRLKAFNSIYTVIATTPVSVAETDISLKVKLIALAAVLITSLVIYSGVTTGNAAAHHHALTMYPNGLPEVERTTVGMELIGKIQDHITTVKQLPYDVNWISVIPSPNGTPRLLYQDGHTEALTNAALSIGKLYQSVGNMLFSYNADQISLIQQVISHMHCWGPKVSLLSQYIVGFSSPTNYTIANQMYEITHANLRIILKDCFNVGYFTLNNTTTFSALDFIQSNPGKIGVIVLIVTAFMGINNQFFKSVPQQTNTITIPDQPNLPEMLEKFKAIEIPPETPISLIDSILQFVQNHPILMLLLALLLMLMFMYKRKLDEEDLAIAKRKQDNIKPEKPPDW